MGDGISREDGETISLSETFLGQLMGKKEKKKQDRTGLFREGRFSERSLWGVSSAAFEEESKLPQERCGGWVGG